MAEGDAPDIRYRPLQFDLDKKVEQKTYLKFLKTEWSFQSYYMILNVNDVNR